MILTGILDAARPGHQGLLAHTPSRNTAMRRPCSQDACGQAADHNGHLTRSS